MTDRYNDKSQSINENNFWILQHTQTLNNAVSHVKNNWDVEKLVKLKMKYI